MAQIILIVDDDSFTRKLVSTTLGKAGYEIVDADSGNAALLTVNDVSPDLIVLDVMMPEMDGYEVCRRLRQNEQTAHTPIIMLTARDTLEEKIKGFEAGADDYITKPFQPAELQARVKVILLRRVEVPQQIQSVRGKAVAVFSLKGGVGVSSLATNIAASLAQIWDLNSVLVDLSLVNGQDALMFNLPLRNTWSDIAHISVDELSVDVLDDVLLTHPSGVKVLAAPKHPAEAELIDGEKVSRAIDLLKDRYHYIVMDMGHNFRDPTIAGLDQADEIVVVFSPELASVRATASALDVFRSLNYSSNQIRLVMNWTFERRGLARADIEDVLKSKISLVIPFAPDTFVTGINLGTPVCLSDPSSAVGGLLEDFSFSLSGSEHKKNRPEKPSETWLRVAKRFQQRRKRRS